MEASIWKVKRGSRNSRSENITLVPALACAPNVVLRSQEVQMQGQTRTSSTSETGSQGIRITLNSGWA